MKNKLWLILVFLVIGIVLMGCIQYLENESEHHELIKAFYLAGFPGDIKVKDFDNREVITLVDGNAGNFDISKDGQKIVYASCETGTWQIYIADVNKDKLSNIRMLSDGVSRSEDPRFSWDNSKVVYKRNGHIVVCTIDGSIIQEITNTSDIEEWEPNFAPDGKIVYIRKKGENYQIIEWNNNMEQVVASELCDAFYPSFGVDGTLYFVGKLHEIEEDDIYCIHPGITSIDKLPINALGASDADPYPAIGTNKKLIAFVSDRDNDERRYEGYIADLETNEVSKIVSDTESVLNLIVFVTNESKHHELNVKNWAIQLQSADPNIVATSGFRLVVIDYSRDGSEQGKFSPEEIRKMKDSGVIPIAYLSIGEAEDYRFYWKEEWYNNPPKWLGKENPEWKGNYAVKYWDEEWKAILYAYLDKIIEQGFSGVYLDKVDEFEYWADSNNGESEYLPENESARRMIGLIVDIANYSRNKLNGEFYIIPQNGERILEYDNGILMNIISGWAAEDLFYNEIEPWNEEDKNWIRKNRFPYLDMVLSKGKPVFSVDYVDDGAGYLGVNKERIDDYREKALNKGYIPYAATSDRELDELNIIEGIQP